MWTQYSESALSMVSTSTALHSVMWHHLPLLDGYQRCVDSRIFSPRLSFCFCDHVPVTKNVKFAFNPKTFRCAFHPCSSPCQHFSLMVTLQSSDWASLKWLREQYTVYSFRFHGSLLGREIADKTWYRNRLWCARSLWRYLHHILTTTWYCCWASDNTE